MTRPFFICGLIGIAMIISGLITTAYMPREAGKLLDGFVTPILALEFAQSESEVYGILGETYSSERTARIETMRKGNQIDFVFMALYTLFLIRFFTICAKLSRNPLYLTGVIVLVLILLADISENLCLLNILSSIGSGGFANSIRWLGLFTWIKWGGLALAAALLLPFLLTANRFSRVIALWSVLAIILGVVSFFWRSFVNELFAWSISTLSVWLVIFSLTFVKKRRILI